MIAQAAFLSPGFGCQSRPGNMCIMFCTSTSVAKASELRAIMSVTKARRLRSASAVSMVSALLRRF